MGIYGFSRIEIYLANLPDALPICMDSAQVLVKAFDKKEIENEISHDAGNAFAARSNDGSGPRRPCHG
jgi:hypothetical protein